MRHRLSSIDGSDDGTLVFSNMGPCLAALLFLNIIYETIETNLALFLALVSEGFHAP